ncbi:MAG TPA: polysaccharide pyruvyl transferase family protein [Luteimonas sp.]
MILLIVGEFDSDNIGDQLIGEGHKVLFSFEGCEARVLSLEHRRDRGVDGSYAARKSSVLRRPHRWLYQRSVQYRHTIESVRHLFGRSAYRTRALDVLQDADALIIGGGQLLSDGTLRMLHRIDELTRLAHERGLPVTVFGTGMSAGKTPFSRRLLRRILGRITEPVRFRDAASMASASAVRATLPRAQAPTPDCAIAGISRSGALDTRSVTVGIAPMAPRILSRVGLDGRDIDRWWMGIARELILLGETPVFFSTGVPADMAYAAALRDRLAADGFAVECLPRPCSTDTLLEQLRGMKRVLAQRLHASISFYALGGVPASASWDQKVAEFYGSIGLDGRVFRVGDAAPAEVARTLVSALELAVPRDDLAAMSFEDARQCMGELRRGHGR